MPEGFGIEDFSEIQDAAEETLKVPEDGESQRADLYLSGALGLSRSFIQKILKSGNLTVSGEVVYKPSKILRGGEEVKILVPPPCSSDIIPEPVDFGVVYEDEDLIVIDKPPGLVVHPAPGNRRGTLVHGLLYRFKDMRAMEDLLRPGIVHRLDKGTSGLMVVARNDSALRALQKSFKERLPEKTYLGLAAGSRIDGPLSVQVPIGRDQRDRRRMAATPSGKEALTFVTPLWNKGPYSFVMCSLRTGRTHQIRVHLRYLRAPLVGDDIYGFRKEPFGPLKSVEAGRPFLHSWRLSFPHPSTGKTMEFRSPLPLDLRLILREVLAIFQE